MTTAIDVMKYIKSQIHPWGELQLQKLVYYSQAWSLVWTGRPIFDEPIEAWQHGPVLRSLRYNASVPADGDSVDNDVRAVVDAVLAYYGTMNGSELSVLTHTESPWLEARGDLPASAASDQEVAREAMRRFHTSQALQGVGPRCPSQSVDADDDEVLQAAAAGAVQWESALELLAK